MDVLAKHPTMAWIVEDADTMLSIFLRERDGLTPYNRLKGRPWRIAWQRLENAWSFAGAREIRTGSTLGGRSVPGSEEADQREQQAIRRVDEGSRWDKKKTLLLSVKGHAVVTERNRASGPATVLPERPDVIANAPEAFVRERSLEKFGFTPGCPACKDTPQIVRMGGTAHIEDCKSCPEQDDDRCQRSTSVRETRKHVDRVSREQDSRQTNCQKEWSQ